MEKKYYNVTYRVSDDIWSANLAYAENADDIRAFYERENRVSGDDIIISDADDYAVEDAQRRHKPIVEIDHVEPAAIETAPASVASAVKSPFAVVDASGVIMPADSEAEAGELAAGYPGAIAYQVEEKPVAPVLDCDHAFPTPHTFWNESPRFIVNGSDLDRLDPSHGSNVAMILRYQAMELLSSAFTVWEDTVLSRDEIDEHAFFSGNSLNLNDGDGYRLDEHLTADHIFAVDVYGRVSGVIGVYDDRSDDYEYFLIY